MTLARRRRPRSPERKTRGLSPPPRRSGSRAAPRSTAQAPSAPLNDADHARLETIIRLTHRRWSIPILSELLRDRGGAKFVTLANRLALSRESLRDTLDHLIEHDFVMRNPGIGHPMRPEYLLADAGHSVAPACAGLRRLLDGRAAAGMAFNKWSLPVVYALGRDVTRFGRLRQALPFVTARALALALKGLQLAGIIERVVLHGYPPSTEYGLTAAGREIAHWLNRFEEG